MHPQALGVVALGELLVLEALGDAPRADRDRDRAAGRPRDAEHLELDVLEHDPALVAVEHEPRGAEQLVALAPAASESSTDARSVISAVWLMSPKSMIPVIEPGVVGERVVDGQVGVGDLRAQPRPDRRGPALELVEHARDRRPGARVADVVEHRAGAAARAGRPRASTRCALGWKKPRIAWPRRAVVSPHATSAASDSSVAAMRLLPGSTS